MGVLPLCKGELEGVENRLNMVYPPYPSLTKGGNNFEKQPLGRQSTQNTILMSQINWLESKTWLLWNALSLSNRYGLEA